MSLKYCLQAGRLPIRALPGAIKSKQERLLQLLIWYLPSDVGSQSGSCADGVPTAIAAEVHSNKYDPQRISEQCQRLVINRHTMSKLTHFDSQGQAHMVDVSAKSHTHRIAIAQGCIEMQQETLELIKSGNAKKGDVLGIARIAGIQGAKKTSDLIPLCHPIALTRVAVEFEILDSSDSNKAQVCCTATAETTGPTGVEMEALAAVNVALLTIYDMCKAVDRGMVINAVRLMEKHGGKSGSYVENKF